jgi:uncharacterized membrane protein
MPDHTPSNPFRPEPSDPNFGYEAWEQPPAQQSLSVTALLSMICSLLCLLSPLGVVLGIASLVLISQSGGRKWGKGFAIVGIVLGMLFSSVLAAVVVGGVQIYQGYMSNLVRPTDALMTAIDQEDWRAVRALLEPKVEPTVSDAQLQAFRAQMRDRLGAYKGLGMDVGPSWGGGRAGSSPPPNALPVPARFEKGQADLFVVIDPPEAVMNIIFGHRSVEKHVGNLHLIDHAGGAPIMLVPTGPSAPAMTPLPAMPYRKPDASKPEPGASEPEKGEPAKGEPAKGEPGGA